MPRRAHRPRPSLHCPVDPVPLLSVTLHHMTHGCNIRGLLCVAHIPHTCLLSSWAATRRPVLAVLQWWRRACDEFCLRLALEVIRRNFKI